MLGNVEDAEEALQDAFVRGYRSLHRCNGPERFGAWLYGILVNCCRTAGARAAKRGRVFLHDDILLSGAALPGPGERAGGEALVRWALAPPAARCLTLAARRPDRGRSAYGRRPGGVRSPAGRAAGGGGDGGAALSLRRARPSRHAGIARRRLQRLGCGPRADAPLGRGERGVDDGRAPRSWAVPLCVPR